MFDSDALPEQHPVEVGFLAPPVELTPEYLTLKQLLVEQQRNYLMIAYHNYKWLPEFSFTVGD